MHDYGSFINLNGIYITNTLVDLYLPMGTILVSAGLFILYKLWRKLR